MLAEAGIPTAACGARGVWDLRTLWRLRRQVREHAPDLVHALLFHANIACRFAGVPRDRLICEIQTVEIERNWHLAVEHLTHARCRCVIGNSPSVIDHLARCGGVPRDRLVLVRGGIDPEPIQAAESADPRTLGLEPALPIVLWTGRLDPVKGLEDLIAAAAAVNRSRPVHLVLAGEGPDRPRLERLVGESGAADRIHLIGRRDDVPSLLAMADVFAFPSRTEGLPNALLEAMAAGLPIVATNVPGNSDLIKDGCNGLLVKAGDTSGLADCLVKLLANKSLAHRLGQEAARTVIESFHVRDTYRSYLDLYASVV
jgi:starch synthase (maltosyl-transferring)